jgi:hypothetical protein
MKKEIRIFGGRYGLGSKEFKPAKLPRDISAAIGSNMFEGFVPTKKNMKIAADYIAGKLTPKQVAELL